MKGRVGYISFTEFPRNMAAFRVGTTVPRDERRTYTEP